MEAVERQAFTAVLRVCAAGFRFPEHSERFSVRCSESEKNTGKSLLKNGCCSNFSCLSVLEPRLAVHLVRFADTRKFISAPQMNIHYERKNPKNFVFESFLVLFKVLMIIENLDISGASKISLLEKQLAGSVVCFDVADLVQTF